MKYLFKLIKHRLGLIGYLCEPSTRSIRPFVELLLADRSLRMQQGKAAHDDALAEFSLKRIVNLELYLLQELDNSSA